MKKKILSIAVVAAVAVAAAWGFNKSNNEVALADVALSNVEALASEESGGGMANACCPIWTVTLEVGGVVWPKVTCTTGGSYKCSDCERPK